MNIDWARLGRAVAHYAQIGAQYIEVPWAVAPEFDALTRPHFAQQIGMTPHGLALVGSGEQSFLQLAKTGVLRPGELYQTVTPCWRDEPIDELHQLHFMKLELFMLDGNFMLELPRVGEAARLFFEAETDTKVLIVPTVHTGAAEGSFDLEAHGVELGSYGVRYEAGIGHWMYATGCAEPRTSIVAARAAPARGYHLAPIPRGQYGELSKVVEELQEAQDAMAQGVNLMVLQELSDLVGAAGAVAARLGSSLDDLVAMARVTRRAFAAGKR